MVPLKIVEDVVVMTAYTSPLLHCVLSNYVNGVNMKSTLPCTEI